MSCQSAPGGVPRQVRGLRSAPDDTYCRVGGPMRCPWYLFHRLFLSLGKDTGAP
ncbi:unnamed protein product [Staurois parvus]|uniref:Uncharacterized protein n=1 Tax=Staurois parvus TaxID=386267 RepID=A0ABN9G203_9NEOB|nr:unnamed protein product [Staurois parvus]